MSNAIESMNTWQERQSLVRVADFQQRLVQRYCQYLADPEAINADQDRANYELRSEFSREVAYLVHLIYREAQEPLVKQLTEFVTTQARPLEFSICAKCGFKVPR